MSSRAELLLLLALAGLAATGSAGPAAGSVLPEAPGVAPGRVSPAPSNPLALARERALDGDYTGVVNTLSPWLDGRKAGVRERTAGWLLMGLAHRRLENWNLASAAFTRVRTSGGPLASYGAWYEANVDHERGRHASAAALCREYRTKWPDGPQADSCLLLMGKAYADAGQRGASLTAYRQYLTLHPDTPHQEEIRLGIALAEAQVNPKSAVPMLQDLVISHAWHSTALAAQSALDELAKTGLDVALPTDVHTRMRQCESARRCGQFDEAWTLFQEIAALAPDDPEVAGWVDRNEDRIARGTRNFDVYAQSLEKLYEEKPDPELAWRIMEAWGRDGRWDNAVAWSRKAKDAFPKSSRWRRAREETAWAETLAGNYPEARAQWGELGKTGGKTGQDSRFYEAFSALQAGDAAGAEPLFTAALARDRDDPALLYWRAKSRDVGNPTGAAEDRARLREVDRHGWYRLLLDSAEARAVKPGKTWTRRDGGWHGEARPQLPEWTRPTVRPSSATGLSVARDELRPRPDDGANWGALRWQNGALTGGVAAPTETGSDAAIAIDAPPQALIPIVDQALPDSYGACLWFDPLSAQKDFFRFAEANQAIWPDLPIVHDLALAGVYEEASRLLSGVFDEWERARGGADTPRAAQIRAIHVDYDAWRQFILFARDDYNASRFCAGLDRKAGNEDDASAARRLAYPIVHAADLWSYGRDFGVDPLLMLGLMRQESTYRAWALSPANAVGLIQVLPSTGARMAASLGVERYSPGDLEEPAYNLRYGTYYFSLLMQRFDGVFPLAVASYNGGPHNVSRWYRQQKGKIALDAFVEQIQYPETRDYVKRVTGYYADYVALYAPEGALVVLPESPTGDDASVVDY